jgi:hypothetical protein
MININNLIKKDIGREVIYKTEYKEEKGLIKSWNDIFIFVVYNCANDWKNFMNYTGCATKPSDLYFIKENNNAICNERIPR